MFVIIYDMGEKFNCFYPASLENLLSGGEKSNNSHLQLAMEIGTF